MSLLYTDNTWWRYRGLILQDLTFIHLGNPDEVADGVINFRKRWQQFTILDLLRKFKLTAYSFQRDDELINVFDGFRTYLSEEAMWELSLQIKPRVQRRPPPLVQEEDQDQNTVTEDHSATI